MKSNLMIDLVWVVRYSTSPAGLGSYVGAVDSKYFVFFFKQKRAYGIWLPYHPGSGRIPRVRHMIDWLVEAFNPAEFPWFRDEFIHPNEFKVVYKDESLNHQFGAFSNEGR